MAMAIATATVRATKAPASFARSSRWNKLGKRMYRGLLKTLARVWNPKDIQDPAIQQKVLAHMQAAERCFRRLDAALERIGPEALTEILRSQKLQSIDRVDNLQALRGIVLALETAAEGRAVKQ
jgi:hypothetical protein